MISLRRILSPGFGDVDANFLAVEEALNALGIFAGTGDPNGQVTASPGAQYRNRAGGAGATWWVKESGVNTNTGWIAK